MAPATLLHHALPELLGESFWKQTGLIFNLALPLSNHATQGKTITSTSQLPHLYNGYENTHLIRWFEEDRLEHISSAQYLAQNLNVNSVVPVSHGPPQLPGQVAPCSPSWQEQTLGAMQTPLPQPKEQRAKRRNAGEGMGTGPQHAPWPRDQIPATDTAARD